jgi:hypothetical protein
MEPWAKLPSSTALVGEFHEGRAVIYLNRVGTPGFIGYDVGFIDETGNIYETLYCPARIMNNKRWPVLHLTDRYQK